MGLSAYSTDNTRKLVAKTLDKHFIIVYTMLSLERSENGKFTYFDR
jgi:hypothetical protein